MTTPANPDDLLAFLQQQLDDDERVAREATPGPWRWVDPGGKVKSALVGPGYPYQTVVPVAGGDVYPSKYDAQHIAGHDPARVLAEVAAQRRILDLHVPWQSGYRWVDADTRVPDLRCSVCHDIPADVDYDNPAYAVEFPCPTLRLLALPYADRPGYREDWKP